MNARSPVIGRARCGISSFSRFSSPPPPAATELSSTSNDEDNGTKGERKKEKNSNACKKVGCRR